MKVLHTADIHLKEHEDERWNTLNKLIEIGTKEKIDIFAISGDLFDKGIDAEKLRPKIRDIFSGNGFKIILIPGNHDFATYESGLYFGEDVIVLNNLATPYEFGDVRIWGMPFRKIGGAEILSEFHSLADKFRSDKTNILLYHGELLDAYFLRRDFGDEGEERYMPIKLSYFKKLNVDYVLAGHFHTNFDVRRLENDGYFIYPGSPISITKRETGQRKINIFEVGQPPTEYLLDTVHFEEVTIELNPFKEKKPLVAVEKCIANTHPAAQIILNISGYLNSEESKLNESDFIERIKEITQGRCIEEHFGFRDIHSILEDELFKNYKAKVEKTDYNELQKKQLIDIALNAMIEAGKQ